ncbi:MAG: TSUP family transporter [Pseudomonadota bacterium]
MLYGFITLTVFLTAVMSGVLGMAGGMVLMAALVLTMNVANAMILHGFVQATSNGSRAWFLREHILWSILPLYLVGAAIAVGGFTLLAIVPDASVVLILVGAFPWAARWVKRLQGLDITKPMTTVACGISVTAAQLLAGASGPLLDTFYLKSPLTREQIVASKAVTQTIGHVLKIVYYGFIVVVVVDLPIWLFVVCIAAAVAGSRIGTLLLKKWNDQDFQKVSQYVILTIATLCIAQGLWELLS